MLQPITEDTDGITTEGCQMTAALAAVQRIISKANSKKYCLPELMALKVEIDSHFNTEFMAKPTNKESVA